MIRIAAMISAGTAKLASSLAAGGTVFRVSKSRRRSRSGRSSIIGTLLRWLSWTKRPEPPEGPAKGGHASCGHLTGAKTAADAASANRRTGDGADFARYIAPPLGV